MLSPLNRVSPLTLSRLQSAPKPATEKLDRAPALDRAATDVVPATNLQAARDRKGHTWQIPRLHIEDWTKGGRNRRRMREAHQAFVERDFSRALEKATHVAEETKSYEARLLLALTQISMGEHAQADALLHTLLCERPYDENTHLARALSAYTRNDVGQAWIGLTQVTVHYPGNGLAWVFRCLANGALNYENLATMDIEHLRRTLPEKVLQPVIAATNDLRRGLTERAFAELDASYHHVGHPEVIDILWAHTNNLLGFRQDALAAYDALLTRDPLNVVAAVLRAGALQPVDG